MGKETKRRFESMGRKQPVDKAIKRQVPRRRKKVKGQGRLAAQDDGEKVRSTEGTTGRRASLGAKAATFYSRIKLSYALRNGEEAWSAAAKGAVGKTESSS